MAKRQASGLYRARVRLDNGSYKYISARTVAELEQKKAIIKRDTQLGTYADDKGLTFGEYADKWLKVHKCNAAHSTRAGYANILKNHVGNLRPMRLRYITTDDIQLCINERAGHWDIQRRIKLTVNQVLEAAIDAGLIYHNKAKGAHVPKKRTKQRRALTEAERRVIPLCDLTLKERAFVYTLWYAGLRPEEARALTKADIDLMRNQITINKAAPFESNKAVISEPKTQQGYRSVPILAELRAVLSDYLAEVPGLYLFPGSSEELMSKTVYRRFWAHIFDQINEKLGGTKELKATDLTPYVFRHEYATVLFYSGIDLKEGAKLMGHKDTRLLIEVYAELRSDNESTLDKLNAYIEAQKKA